MSRLDDMTTALFGNERVEVTASAASSETYTITGHATSSSAEGTVWVNLSDDVTHGDNEPEDDSELGTSVEMSTTVNVLEGDEVIVTVYGGVISSMVVTGVVGRGDEQDDKINDAQRAAQAAWDWADESHDAAVQAQRDADAAEAAAGAAQQSADSAAADAASAAASAQTANENALQAIGDAAAASAAARAAQGSADSAAESARTAQQTADAAQQSANTAQGAANAAQQSANAANAHATAALNSLSTVEDVVDTLTWITEHGTMAKTTDTAVDPSKVYFVRDDNGDYTVGGNRYSIVQEPAASGLSGYYELTIDKSVENYIATHLSVTNEGLWLTPTESNGYRVLVATGGSGKTYPTAGTYIIDGSGATVAQFTGTGISFADDRTFYIGDSDAYIFFDGNGHINIGGSNVTIGGSTTLAELLAKYDATITSDDISVSKTGGTATITVGGDTVTISDGAAGAQGPKGNDGTSVTVSRVEYGTSASASSQPSSWSTSVPTSIAKGQWLWVKTSYSDGTDAMTKSYVGTDGQNGQNGTNGTDGGRWYAGTKITGTSTTATVFSGSGITAAVVGDMYLNTSTYNTYRCTVAGNASTAKWVYTTANIKGATGEQGPQGETGAKGDTGAQGPQGETGSAGTNGVSITGVEHQYYLSTSSTSQTGGSWTVKPAAYVRGRYYWERWKVSFSSGDPTYTTATLAEEVTSAWTAIESNEDAIALKANSSDVYTKTDVDGKITQEATDRDAAITAKANEITSSVSETYATKTAVNGKADASDVTALAGRVTTAESNITQNAQNIELKVSKDGVISSINQSAESVTIDASKINLVGAVTIGDLASDTQDVIYQSAQPNLTPFFEIAPTDTTYWFATGNLSSYTTRLGNGWSHVEYSNLNINVSPRVGVLDLSESTTYTVMLEVRNAVTLTNCRLYIYTATNSTWSASKNIVVAENGTYYITGITKDDLSSTDITHLRVFFGSDTSTVNADIRLSLYEGEYSGPYKPYNGGQLYAHKSDVAWTGTCATAAGTAAKEVVCDGFTASELTMGATICVRFNAANTSTGALTLNVNGTSAKTIAVATGDTSSTNQLLWASGATIRFLYNGSKWRVADTTPTYYSTCSIAEGVAAKTAGCAGCVIFKGVAIHIVMTAANTNTSATLNVNSTGAKAIYYGNTTTRPTTANEYGWKAGATASFVFDGAYWRYADASAMYQSASAAKTATNYITQVDQNGITIHPSGGTSNRVEIDADGMEVYKGNVSVASYGDTARIGKEAGPRVVIETDKLSMYAGSTGETKIAEMKEASIGDDVVGLISTDVIVADRIGNEGGPQMTPTALYVPDGSEAYISTMTLGASGYRHKISGFNFGFSSATTNSNGITTFNPNLGVQPTAVFVAPGKASNETEAVAKIAVPMVWSIDSATQVQVRWQRSDTNTWLVSNAVGWYWLALA